MSLHYLVKYVDWQFRVVGAGCRALVDVIARVCVCVCVYVAGYCRHMRASSISGNSSAYRPPASRQLAELHRAVFITCRCIRHATSAARSVARGPRRLPVLNLCCEISAHGLVSYCAAVCNVLSYRYVHYSGCQRLRHMVAPRGCNTNYHVPTHTHTLPFNGPFSGTTRVSRYQKGKTSLDFTEARDSEWQWHQLGHMQVCTSVQTDNHASTQFLQAGCHSGRPTNSVKALKAQLPSNLMKFPLSDALAANGDAE